MMKNYIFAVIFGMILFSPVAAANPVLEKAQGMQYTIPVYNECNKIIAGKLGQHFSKFKEKSYTQVWIEGNTVRYILDKSFGKYNARCTMDIDVVKREASNTRYSLDG